MAELEDLQKHVAILERLVDELAMQFVQTSPPAVQDNVAPMMRAFYEAKKNLDKVEL